MGVITISLNDEVEKKLRALARLRFSKAKGHLSKAITEALKEWAEKSREEELEDALEMLEKGFNMGGMITKKREDWHKR